MSTTNPILSTVNVKLKKLEYSQHPFNLKRGVLRQVLFATGKYWMEATNFLCDSSNTVFCRGFIYKKCQSFQFQGSPLFLTLVKTSTSEFYIKLRKLHYANDYKNISNFGCSFDQIILFPGPYSLPFN